MSNAPPRESIMGYFPSEEEAPMDEEALIEYMQERSKKLDANKDANAGLTKDADHKVDLKEEAALILASAPGPEYVTDVYLTVNGQKGEKVPINSLQWYMFKYTELMHGHIDVYEDPNAEPQVSTLAVVAGQMAAAAGEEEKKDQEFQV